MRPIEIKNKIKKIKQEILRIDEMRPGSLSKQYNVCGVEKCRCKDPENPQKHGPYFKLSSVHQRKGSTKFIREIFVKKIKKETIQYKKLKELMDQWIALSIKRSDMEMQMKIEEKDQD